MNVNPRIRGKKGSKAISPTVSMIILMGATIAVLLVAFVFATNRLWFSVAQSEFNSAKQYMQTVGLQIDDVAWTVGRKETLRYSSNYGSVSILQNAINYTIYVKTQGNSIYQYFTNNLCSAILFNMPTSSYTLGNNYYEPIYPQSSSANVSYTGTSAPVARVFGVEKLVPPMSDGNFVRVAVAPTIRFLSSSVNSTSSKVYYLRLYLPAVTKGSNYGSAQSVTMTGTSLETSTQNKITSVTINVTLPIAGFDNSFFHYSTTSQVINVPSGYNDAILELYVGNVETVLGVQS